MDSSRKSTLVDIDTLPGGSPCLMAEPASIALTARLKSRRLLMAHKSA